MGTVTVNIIDESSIQLLWETENTFASYPTIRIYGSNWIGDRTDPEYFNEILTITNPVNHYTITEYKGHEELQKSCIFNPIIESDYTYKFYKFVIEEIDGYNEESLSSNIIIYKQNDIIRSFNAYVYTDTSSNFDIHLLFDLSLYGEECKIIIYCSTSKDGVTFTDEQVCREHEITVDSSPNQSFVTSFAELDRFVKHGEYAKLRIEVCETISDGDGSNSVINLDNTNSDGTIAESDVFLRSAIELFVKVVGSQALNGCSIYTIKNGRAVASRVNLIKNGESILVY